VYWWYLVRKECGNIYLDIDVTIGSGVSGIRDGTATPVRVDSLIHSLPNTNPFVFIDSMW
jgi:hypothetical protein